MADSPKVWDGKDASEWLAFSGVTGLNVYGLGAVDGGGGGGGVGGIQSCRYPPHLNGCIKLAPTFLSRNKSSLSNLRIINSPQTHVLAMGGLGLLVANLIQSSENSPNTDGIDFQYAHSVTITNTKFGCDQTSDINIHNVQCGPRHGMSIGSLGKDGSFAWVESVLVNNSSFEEAANGAPIKTWQVGSGYVQKIRFDNLKFDKVENPIMIGEWKMRTECKSKPRGIQIADVSFKGFSETSSTNVAINLKCCRAKPCTGKAMESIKLTAAGAGKASAGCSNVHGNEKAVVPGPNLSN
ncbi:Polygalacturonase [Bertholletia excelsa]